MRANGRSGPRRARRDTADATGRLRAPAATGPIRPLAVPPSFSVVIPAYQAATTIGETIDSILAQSSAPHEVIVADDGSTDDLDAALRPFGRRVSLIRIAHRGAAAPRNAGARAATGDFVLIVDADDLLLERKLEAIGTLARHRPDLDLLCTDVFFDAGGRRARTFGEANPFPVEDQRGDPRAVLRRLAGGSPSTAAGRRRLRRGSANRRGLGLLDQADPRRRRRRALRRAAGRLPDPARQPHRVARAHARRPGVHRREGRAPSRSAPGRTRRGRAGAPHPPRARPPRRYAGGGPRAPR